MAGGATSWASLSFSFSFEAMSAVDSTVEVEQNTTLGCVSMRWEIMTGKSSSSLTTNTQSTRASWARSFGVRHRCRKMPTVAVQPRFIVGAVVRFTHGGTFRPPAPSGNSSSNRRRELV